MATLHKKLPGSNQSKKNGVVGGGNIKSLTKNFRTLLLEEGNFNAKFANYKKAENDKGFVFELHGETKDGTLFLNVSLGLQKKIPIPLHIRSS